MAEIKAIPLTALRAGNLILWRVEGSIVDGAEDEAENTYVRRTGFFSEGTLIVSGFRENNPSSEYPGPDLSRFGDIEKVYLVRSGHSDVELVLGASDSLINSKLKGFEWTDQRGEYYGGSEEVSPNLIFNSNVYVSKSENNPVLKKGEVWNLRIEKADRKIEWYFRSPGASTAALEPAPQASSENWIPCDFMEGWPLDGNSINGKTFYFGEKQVFCSAKDDQKKLSSPIKSMYANRKHDLWYDNVRYITPEASLLSGDDDYYNNFVRNAGQGQESFIPNLLADPAAFKLDSDIKHALPVSLTAGALAEPKQILFGSEGIYLWTLGAQQAQLAKVSDFQADPDIKPVLSDILLIAKSAAAQELYYLNLNQVLRGVSEYMIGSPMYLFEDIKQLVAGVNGVLWVIDGKTLNRFLVDKKGLLGRSHYNGEFYWTDGKKHIKSDNRVYAAGDGEVFDCRVKLFPLIYSGFFPANAMKFNRLIKNFFVTGSYGDLNIRKNDGPFQSLVKAVGNEPYRMLQFPLSDIYSHDVIEFMTKPDAAFQLYNLGFFGNYGGK